jgi:coenzyme F420-0:L-glutamate ligase/coenzyme F420-1:gamma-L-glutamate ligase
MDEKGSMSATRIELIGLGSVPDVRPGDDVTRLVLDAAASTDVTLAAGDILVVTHKVISKAEGRLVDLRTVAPSELARRIEREWGKDARYIEVVLRESVRIVRMARGLIISETAHGLVCANAGVDASNISGGDEVCLLPADPDASAAALRTALGQRAGVDLAVVVTDSFGRPWRNGITNVAIGVAGMAPFADYRGRPDDYGRVMSASIMAIADEVASAAELITGKVNRCPFVLVRGYPYERRESTAAELVMDASMDLFR